MLRTFTLGAGAAAVLLERRRGQFLIWRLERASTGVRAPNRRLLCGRRQDMSKYLALLLLAAALLAPSAGLSHSHKQKNLEVVHPYTFETIDRKATTALVFMVIKNTGSNPERLLSASTPRAAKVELTVVEGVARDAAFTVGPGKSLVLGPRGGHLVLKGVRKAFTAYDAFKMTLVFEKSGRMEIDVVVEEPLEDEKK
jgi:copper(I)-binding protein